MPQLASGEIGWAIDEQELYIGNGAVSEGAPAVGNTQILTENSDIFALANQYAYRPTNSLWGSTTLVQRSLQSRLDDFVTVYSFGAIGNGVVDDTQAIQNALDSLYLNGDQDSKVMLYFPAGTYKISSTIYIPPFASIKGAGKDKTIIVGNIEASMFKTVNSSSTSSSRDPSASISMYSAGGNQARYIDISDITFEQQAYYTVFEAKDMANSNFARVKIKGPWILTAGTEAQSIGLQFNSSSNGATCINNKFEDIEFQGLWFAVYSDFDIKNNIISKSHFYVLGYGVAFGIQTDGGSGQITGPLHNTIENCWFDLVNNEAINIPNGRYNTSKGNKFAMAVAYSVNNDDNISDPVTPYPSTYIINFGHYTNVSDQDWFERTQLLTPNDGAGDISFFNETYFPEVNGSTNSRLLYNSQITIGTRSGTVDPETLEIIPEQILKLPLIVNGMMFVDYVYVENSNSLVRTGTWEILVNREREAEGGISVTEFRDTYSSSVGTPNPSELADGLIFYATATDTSNPEDGSVDTIKISCYNSINVSSDTFTYSVRIKT